MDPNQKKDKKRGYNLRSRNKKIHIVSDNDASSSSDDEDYEPGSEEFMDESVFKEFLYKLFPSKHLNSKIKEMDAITEKMDEEDAKKCKRKGRKKPASNVTSLQVIDDESESETDDDDDDDDDNDEYDEYGDEEMEAVINIVLNISDVLEEYETGTESETETESGTDGESEREQTRKGNPKSTTKNTTRDKNMKEVKKKNETRIKILE